MESDLNAVGFGNGSWLAGKHSSVYVIQERVKEHSPTGEIAVAGFPKRHAEEYVYLDTNENGLPVFFGRSGLVYRSNGEPYNQSPEPPIEAKCNLTKLQIAEKGKVVRAFRGQDNEGELQELAPAVHWRAVYAWKDDGKCKEVLIGESEDKTSVVLERLEGRPSWEKPYQTATCGDVT